MDIEVEEYVRLKQGIIAKVSNINDFREPSMKFGIDANYFKDIVFVGENDIVKHSKNIIDLIEVGDYVNGYKVSDKESTLLSTNVKGIDRSGYHIPISQYGENIETILTHEQYESNCYRLEE